MANILVELNNNKVRFSGDLKILNKAFKELSFKHPQAWHIRSHMPKGWDMQVHPLTEHGYIRTGLLPKVVKVLQGLGATFEVEDNRTFLLKSEGIPNQVGNHLLTGERAYQWDAIRAVVDSQVLGVPFPRGVINAATNAGKTTICAGIHLAYGGAPTLLLLNDKTLFEQFKVEMPELLGSMDVGFVQGKTRDFRDFTVAMVPTLYRNILNFQGFLARYKIVLVDECELGTSKSYTTCMQKAFNTVVRVGLSGSPFISKDPMKNLGLEQAFGPEIFNISKVELVEKGISTKPVIKICRGGEGVKVPGDYNEEYRAGIINSEIRHDRQVERMRYNASRGRLPAVVVCKYHDHVDTVYARMKAAFPEYTIAKVHHKTKYRNQILKHFREGATDILVASLIIKRGQNLPLIQYIQNVSATDNPSDIPQIMGRGERSHASKNKFYIDDFFDFDGRYLQRHSKHRVAYYKRQGFRVIELYKK